MFEKESFQPAGRARDTKRRSPRPRSGFIKLIRRWVPKMTTSVKWYLNFHAVDSASPAATIEAQTLEPFRTTQEGL
jgi:hypothetical protein